MKKCIHCGCNLERILISLTDAAKERIICPNCVAEEVISGNLTFEPNYDLVDDITGLPGAVKFQFLGDSEHYTLAPRAMLRLLAHDLRPDEWTVLIDKYGDQYMLHDDFYTEDGEAWQPYIHIPTFEWRDVVEINGQHYVEKFEISGKMDDDTHYQIDDFLEQVARKHNVNTDDIKTYMMDDIEFNPQSLGLGAEDCGCYIDGVPEWCTDEDEHDDDELLPNPLCHYTIKGSISPFEDEAITSINFNVMMNIDNNGIVDVGAVNILRIPSHKNIKGLSTRHLAPGYDMSVAMDDYEETLSIVADEMKLLGDFQLDGCRRCLKTNDLYYISSIFIKPEYRGKGVGLSVMKNLVKWIQTVTGDIQPVIALLPYPSETDVQYGSAEWYVLVKGLKHLFNKVGYRTVAEDAITMSYTPYPKGLYQDIEY